MRHVFLGLADGTSIHYVVSGLGDRDADSNMALDLIILQAEAQGIQWKHAVSHCVERGMTSAQWIKYRDARALSVDALMH